jgi:hypothetical protein
MQDLFEKKTKIFLSFFRKRGEKMVKFAIFEKSFHFLQKRG